MKKHAITVVLLLCVSMLFPVAASAAGNLYSWYSYQDNAYQYFKKADSSSLKKLLATYEKMIAKQSGSRKTVPPGIYADYGWLLIKNGRISEGKEMLKKEMELYPESSTFIRRVLQRFEANEE